MPISPNLCLFIFLVAALLLALRGPRRLRHGMATAAGLAMMLLVVRVGFWEVYRTSGPSMSPTIPSGSLVMINHLVYRLPAKNPGVGEIVAFKTGADIFLKRVIATPGDHVAYVPGRGWAVNGHILAGTEIPPSEVWLRRAGLDAQRSHTLNLAAQTIRHAHQTRQPWTLRIPSGALFVLGDNSTHSMDSREIGLVERASVIGRVDWIVSQ